MPKKLILVIDDERDIQKLLQYNLEKEGYQVLTASSGEEGLGLARTRQPNLIVLDLMLPGMDGFETCKILQSDPKTRYIPVLILTAKNSETDQILGLELGALDYVAKPFSVRVLTARVKNALKRQETSRNETPVLKAGGLVLDKGGRRFLIKGKPVSLTKLEFNILGFLMENPDKVFSRDELLSGAWHSEGFVVDRTVDVHMRSIRQKLGKYRGCIQTIRGSGYRFSENPAP